MRCVVTRRLAGDWERPLNESYDELEIVDPGRALEPAELERAVAGADALLCTVYDRIDRSLLEHAPRLRMVATYSVGYDHLDVPALRARGIRVSHTPGVLTDATADLAWALILGCARRVKPAMRWIEAGRFEGFDPTAFLGLELNGAVLGIVGPGKIGQAVGMRAGGFRMHVLAAGRAGGTPPPNWEMVGLDSLLSRADVVSLHCPLTSDTRHLIGVSELGRMKRDAILINTARGPIIDEEALLRHLESNPEFFAGLDVFEREPEVAEALLRLPNALCLPHIGSATQATRARMAQICVEELIRFAKGEPLRYEIG